MRKLTILLILFLVGCYVYFRIPPGPNELTRLFSIAVFVDDGVFHIDRYAELTPDKGYQNGHYYSDKAPGTFFLGVPIYLAVRAVTGLPGGEALHTVALTVLQVLLAALPTAALGAIMLHLLRALGMPPRGALLVTLSYALATIAFPFATMLFGHQLATALGFAAVALAFSAHLAPGRVDGVSQRRMVACGLLVGLATVVEYTSAIVAVALVGYTWRAFGRRQAIAVVAGGVPMALALVGYNTLVFGDPFRLSYQYVVDPLWAGMREGFVGLTVPRPGALVEILFGARGLFFLSPHLVFGVFGLVRMVRHPRYRLEGWFCAGVVVAFALMNASYYAPIGHWSMGPRFLTIVVPFLVLPAAVALDSARKISLHRLLTAISFAIVFAGTAVDPKVRTEIAMPLIDLYLPRLLRGEIAPTIASELFGVSGHLALVPIVAWLVIGGSWLFAMASVPKDELPDADDYLDLAERSEPIEAVAS